MSSTRAATVEIPGTLSGARDPAGAPVYGTVPVKPAATALVSLRTLIVVRWITIAGQAGAVLVGSQVLDLALPLDLLVAAILVSVLVNLASMVQRRYRSRLGDREALSYLAYDQIQLAFLLYLSGGVANPFAVFALVPLTVAASLLDRRATLGMAALTLAVLTVLRFFHYPVMVTTDAGPVPFGTIGLGVDALDFLRWQVTPIDGIWVALSMTAVFIAGYVWAVTNEAKRLERAFVASQMALSRAQRASALGALAAAAAHDLGTPLGTITVIARELELDLPEDSPHKEDVHLLLAEAERCRDILAALSQRPDSRSGADEPASMAATAVLDLAARPHHVPGKAIRISLDPTVSGPVPRLPVSPEVMHGLGNLLQNALQFARADVHVRVSWSGPPASGVLRIEILDDGPGFQPQVLRRLGEPPEMASASAGEAGSPGRPVPGLGLGVFIASTLLGHTGAEVSFGNRRGGPLGAARGAKVVVEWRQGRAGALTTSRDLFEDIR